MVWFCLLLTCLGVSWFAYQYVLVPHPASFAPQWQGAKWVQATDGRAPVAYFRYDTTLTMPPDGAFVTVAASQVFRLYVNSTFIGSNSQDFIRGDLAQAYMYDIASPLHAGRNVIAVRVANVDLHVPALRIAVGIANGQSTSVHGSDQRWQATAVTGAAHPRYVNNPTAWADSSFDDSGWQAASLASAPVGEPAVRVNPLIYQQPMPTHWISAGSGHEAYFVRQIRVPVSGGDSWLRLVATGTASVFINGNLFMIWNGQAPVQQQAVADYLSTDATVAQYRSGLVMGIYNISSYLHQGLNTIAVHVAAPGILAARAGLDTLNAAMALDVLSVDSSHHAIWPDLDEGWHVSSQPVDGWTQGNQGALNWSAPLFVGRPGAARTLYLSDVSDPHGQQFISLSLTCVVVLGSCLAVLLLWLCGGLLVLKRCFVTRRIALEACALTFLPALAVEALLMILAMEPRVPRPFPYTLPWGLLLCALVPAGWVLLVLHAHLICLRQRRLQMFMQMPTSIMPMVHAPLRSRRSMRMWVRARIPLWVRLHWGLLLVLGLAIPLICSHLAYEPYWQDELTSYFAAKGIIAHGVPLLPSGFLYPKGELYSYLLALTMMIFGEQHGMIRMPSVVEYLVSLPMLYLLGCLLFQHRIALLATAMLAFSPTALTWGQQVRMYEQAQLMAIVVIYLFYRVIYVSNAVSSRKHICLIYLAFAALVLDYLSHEETFIIFPALALWLVCVCYARYLRPLLAYLREPARYGRPSIQYHLLKHWLLAGLLAGSIIGLQLLIVRVSHPALLGTDQSQRPLVHFTTDNIPYYMYVMFYPALLGNGSLPWITLNSLLVVAGIVLAVRRRDLAASYCGLFFFVPFLTLMLIFTLASDRYIYPLLPMYYLLGAYSLVTLLQEMWVYVCSCLVHMPWSNSGADGRDSFASPLVSFFTYGMTAVLICAVLLLPMLPLSDYNHFVSEVTGMPYHRHYADYDAIRSYMQKKWRQGDIVVAVSPAISVLYYVGRVDYFFSIDRALYLFEKDGHIIDTPTGSTALLDQQDFQAVVSAHARVWIISDNGLYQAQTTKDSRFVFPQDFHLVYEGYGSAIYYRGS